MWFKRKYRNRRFKRYEVLEVKLRSSQTRAARLRLLSFTLGITLGTLAVLYVGWRLGQKALNYFVYENPAFAVRVIDIQTDGVIRIDQLRRWAGVRAGENLLALDLSRIKRNMELSPLIQAVALERSLPDTLKLRVSEREPIAQIHTLQPRANHTGLEPVIYQLDENGYVMMPLDPRLQSLPADASDVLPMMTGVPQTELRPGRKVESPQVHAALQLLREFEHSPMVGLVDIKQINVTAPEILRVTTNQGSEIIFATQGLETQMRRWRTLHDYGMQHRLAIANLDLSVRENTPASWIEASVVPPSSAKTVKASRYRKKNV